MIAGDIIEANVRKKKGEINRKKKSKKRKQTDLAK